MNKSLIYVQLIWRTTFYLENCKIVNYQKFKKTNNMPVSSKSAIDLKHNNFLSWKYEKLFVQWGYPIYKDKWGTRTLNAIFCQKRTKFNG